MGNLVGMEAVDGLDELPAEAALRLPLRDDLVEREGIVILPQNLT